MRTPFDIITPGLIKTAAPIPVAGNPLIITPPTNTQAMLISFEILVQTSAVVATRQFRVEITGGAYEYTIGVSHTTLPASSTFYINAGIGLNNFAMTAGNWISMALTNGPRAISGETFNLLMDNIDAGDQLGNCFYTLFVWPFDAS